MTDLIIYYFLQSMTACFYFCKYVVDPALSLILFHGPDQFIIASVCSCIV